MFRKIYLSTLSFVLSLGPIYIVLILYGFEVENLIWELFRYGLALIFLFFQIFWTSLFLQDISNIWIGVEEEEE